MFSVSALFFQINSDIVPIGEQIGSGKWLLLRLGREGAMGQQKSTQHNSQSCKPCHRTLESTAMGCVPEECECKSGHFGSYIVSAFYQCRTVSGY